MYIISVAFPGSSKLYDYACDVVSYQQIPHFIPIAKEAAGNRITYTTVTVVEKRFLCGNKLPSHVTKAIKLQTDGTATVVTLAASHQKDIPKSGGAQQPSIIMLAQKWSKQLCESIKRENKKRGLFGRR